MPYRPRYKNPVKDLQIIQAPTPWTLETSILHHYIAEKAPLCQDDSALGLCRGFHQTKGLGREASGSRLRVFWV